MIPQQFESSDTAFSLNNRKPRLALPAKGHHRIALYWAAETAFTVDEADDPLLESWPFLLIVRTGRIVTAHVDILLKAYDTNEYRRILGVSSI